MEDKLSKRLKGFRQYQATQLSLAMLERWKKNQKTVDKGNVFLHHF